MGLYNGSSSEVSYGILQGSSEGSCERYKNKPFTIYIYIYIYIYTYRHIYIYIHIHIYIYIYVGLRGLEMFWGLRIGLLRPGVWS